MVMSAGIQRALQRLDAVENCLRDRHGVGAGALGDGECHRRRPFRGLAGEARDQKIAACAGEAHVRHVADIDRPPVAAGYQEVADGFRRLQRLAGKHRHLLPAVAHPSGREGSVGALHLAGELLEGDSVEREPVRVGRDAQHLSGLAHEIG